MTKTTNPERLTLPPRLTLVAVALAVAVQVQTTMVEVRALEVVEVSVEMVGARQEETADSTPSGVGAAATAPAVVTVVDPVTIVSTRIIPTTKATTLAKGTKSPTFPGRNTRTWTNPILASRRLPTTIVFVAFPNPMPIPCAVNRRENREQL